MADYPSDAGQFSDKEMALILKLASELEQRNAALTLLAGGTRRRGF